MTLPIGLNLNRQGHWLWLAATLLGLGFACQSTVSGTDPGIVSAPNTPGAEATTSNEPAPALHAPEEMGRPPLLTGQAPTPEDFCTDVANVCVPPQTSEHLPARALPPPQLEVTETVTLQEIYNRFETACGRCHKGEPRRSNGNWAINGPLDVKGDDRLGAEAIARLTSEDPTKVMPPTRGVAASGAEPAKVLPRGATDDLLLSTLKDWLDKGRGETGFTRQKEAVPYDAFYDYPSELRDSFTNLGSCIPDAEMVGCAQSEMQRMDDKFRAIRSFADLPKRLEQTDLFTLDSALLAQQRVLSYAPTYTLFSGQAKKMRYVRVPLGEKIHYDAATKDLVVPQNTRFYKTFLREVTDASGRHAYRRIETRIIVVRDDVLDEQGVSNRQVIFGSYLWSLDESRAELVDKPYDDQTPFRDLLLRHVTDEPRALANGYDANTQEGIDAATEADYRLRALAPSAKLDRTQLLTQGYALPGRDRCIQCHMGSSSRSYILGFNPYQVDRRTDAEGGVFDAPAGPDEVSQLDRLVEYGVIDPAGIPEKQPGETSVFKLEDSQEVKPRNEFELKAQAYMLGNCAFCHNPRGFPSVENPSLKDLLNFFPNEQTNGGVFHFPLETFSPRTSRGPSFNVKFPYITPSFFERAASDDESRSFTVSGTRVFVVAPWRALLFRNVQTPFTYSADDAIHPHMPLNVPGYDPRVPEIMGDWMLSIPARLKGPRDAASGAAQAPVALEPKAENRPDFLGVMDPEDPDAPLDLQQPWEEVKDDDPLYADYVKAATLRREAFRSPRIISQKEYFDACPSSISHDCEDSYAGPHAYLGAASFRADNADVFAWEMRPGAGAESPLDDAFKIVPGAAPADPVKIVRSSADLTTDEVPRAIGWEDLIPDRPHFLDRDLTIRPGAWVPRRSTWYAAFASEEAFLPAAPDLSNLPAELQRQERSKIELRREQARRVYDPLMHFQISDKLREFASTERPYGLWKEPLEHKTALGEEQACDKLLGPHAEPKLVRDFKEEPPHWFLEDDLDSSDAGPSSEQPVYMQLPGQSMFNLICSNCHGKDANASSLLAGTILELTGGKTRVANLRDGLFGDAGKNRAEVFPGQTFPNESSETMAVRYLLWMGLGGTEAIIPSVVLNRVGATRPLNVDRKKNPNSQATANMLANAIGFCQDSIGMGQNFDHERLGPGVPEFDAPGDSAAESALVASNGDAELWVSLCGLDNTPPIRVVDLLPLDGANPFGPRFRINRAYWRDLDGVALVPEHARIGDQRGNIRDGLTPDNTLPWCIAPPADPAQLAELIQVWQSKRRRPDEEPPICPASLFVHTGIGADQVDFAQVAPLNQPDRRRDVWATRGAMNVGASVFLYLDGLSKGSWQRKPAFDACVLPKAAN